ncbi:MULTISPECIES: CheR family methyltransferase [unclassified Sphingomonas]|uniref:CheR family methyltransferase n=1 Tax=unclassified Sphingomonas TaxID=196159 RepID=UPI00082E3D8A|nr:MULTISPECIES: protein-glutamate O-methyltransferase CheR [unclassified Sphingomonas]
MNAALALDRMPGISPDVYRTADFEAVRDIVHGEVGIVLPNGKAMLVYSRLAPLVRNAGCGTFANYVKRIESDQTERKRAICALTTNHTFFFREGHHFDHLHDDVRPALQRKLSAGQPVRIWSAGCSSGEETWSLVTTMLGEDRGVGHRMAESDLIVLASDIADHALISARQATYSAASLEAVPAPLRKLWFDERDGLATVSAAARAVVRFRTLNLLGPWPMSRLFDVIFCRNVMIYFDQPTKERLVARFAEQLLPGGTLYIGHSERVTGPAAALLSPIGPTIYRKSAR